MIERRRFGRRAVTLPAEVCLPLRPSLPCTLLNVSEGGALVQCDRYEHVPAKFRLRIGQFETDCHVRHRERTHIGVEFMTPYRFDA